MATTSSIPNETVVALAQLFQLRGTPFAAEPYGTGHINDTFRVLTRDGATTTPYILQRINHKVFPRPDQVMENIVRVTSHLRRAITAGGGNADRETLTVLPTRDGAPFLLTAEGNTWRAYIFITGARTHDVLVHADQAFQAAAAFARFQRQLRDLEGPPLHDTIPAFHHTPSRFARLQDAIAKDVASRLASCQPEVEFALAQEALTTLVATPLEAGELPLRVTHNDTKINNVMLDDETGAGICVIDLDTVMPGSLLYDFGDQVRTSVGHFRENETDLNRVYADLDRFRALVRGFLPTIGDAITPLETDLLDRCGALITFEIGIRFLTDYLQGDIYFKTHHAAENLHRARTQFALVRSLYSHARTLREIVQQYR